MMKRIDPLLTSGTIPISPTRVNFSNHVIWGSCSAVNEYSPVNEKTTRPRIRHRAGSGKRQSPGLGPRFLEVTTTRYTPNMK